MNPERLREEPDRSAGPFAPIGFEDVYGCLKYHGPSMTVAAMDEAVLREARKHRSGSDTKPRWPARWP